MIWGPCSGGATEKAVSLSQCRLNVLNAVVRLWNLAAWAGCAGVLLFMQTLSQHFDVQHLIRSGHPLTDCADSPSIVDCAYVEHCRLSICWCCHNWQVGLP